MSFRLLQISPRATATIVTEKTAQTSLPRPLYFYGEGNSRANSTAAVSRVPLVLVAGSVL
jgi:hypothetical protein